MTKDTQESLYDEIEALKLDLDTYMQIAADVTSREKELVEWLVRRVCAYEYEGEAIDLIAEFEAHSK